MQGFLDFPTGKNPEDSKTLSGAWRPRNGSSSTYPSVMIGVTENISLKHHHAFLQHELPN
jgi:hypothetical protein